MAVKPRRVSRLRRARRFKLRTRVLAGVLGITLTALVAFDFAVVTALHSYLINQTDSRLKEVLSLYGPLTATEPGKFAAPGVNSPISRKATVPRQCQVNVQGHTVTLTGPQCVAPRIAGLRASLPAALGPFLVGSVTGKAPKLRLTALVKTEPYFAPRLPGDLRALAISGQGTTVLSTDGRQQVRLLARVIPDSGLVVAYTSLTGANSTDSRVAQLLIVGSAAAGLLAAAGTAWLMRRGLRPVERMAGQADKISAGDLTGRVSPHDPRTEVGRLGVALNGMLARIEEFVAEREASQRATTRFFADASHELRTPLASLRANAELYQQGALPEREQVDEAMRRIVAEARRMGILVDDMLRLARLDQHPERRSEPVDVTELAGECLQRARTAYPEWTWHARIDSGLEASGDEELLRRAIDNLLTNVAAHTPPGSAALLTAEQSGVALIIEVSDNGPGVPGEQLTSIFDRFYRANAPSPRPGSGLGLAIVAAAMAAHDGTVQAMLNQPSGLRVTLTLPAAGATQERTDPAGSAAGESAEPAAPEPGDPAIVVTAAPPAPSGRTTSPASPQ